MNPSEEEIVKARKWIEATNQFYSERAKQACPWDEENPQPAETFFSGKKLK